MVGRTRFACLLPILIFIALRTVSHAHPTPPPGAVGVFDGEGLDDLLQTIRIPCMRSANDQHQAVRALAAATGRVSVPEPSLVKTAFLVSTRSRAPPRT